MTRTSKQISQNLDLVSIDIRELNQCLKLAREYKKIYIRELKEND